MQDKIELEVSYFSHLLNCLANQKYLLEMLPADRVNGQMVIDEAWNKGMAMISPILQKNAIAKKASSLGQQKWMADIDKIKQYCELDEKQYPQDTNIVFKWSQLIWQEVWMYGSLGEKIDPAEFHVLCERRGFTPRMSGYLSSVLIHMELLDPTDAKVAYGEPRPVEADLLTANVEKYTAVKIEIHDTRELLANRPPNCKQVIEVEVIVDDQKAEMTLAEFKQCIFGPPKTADH